MKLYAFYFSPTGSTKKVLNLVTSVWDCDIHFIDLSNHTIDYSHFNFHEDDVCIVAVPSFSGRVPQFIIPRLNMLNGKGNKTILVATFGNRAFDDTLLELQNTLENKGFICVSAIAAATQHSVLPTYGHGRPDAEDLKELTDFAYKCKSSAEKEAKSVCISGNYPYRPYLSIPIYPKANSSCVSCGLCAKKCPVHAISSKSLRKINKDKCISCLQCISVCPKHARHLNPLIQKIATYKLKNLCKTRKANTLFQ